MMLHERTTNEYCVCLVVPTQFGNVPDVAWEEVKQIRAQQQQQQTGSIPAPVSSLASSSTASQANTTDVLPSSTRATSRDATVAHANSLVRSRSLAANSTARPSAAAMATAAPSTHVSNPAQQTLLFTTNKPSFLTPTRFGVGRLTANNLATNNAHPPGPSSSSTSYTSNRSLPVNTSSNFKSRYANTHNHHSHYGPTVTINAPATTTTSTAATNNDQQRSVYETTYRASFFKPLAP